MRQRMLHRPSGLNVPSQVADSYCGSKSLDNTTYTSTALDYGLLIGEDGANHCLITLNLEQ